MSTFDVKGDSENNAFDDIDYLFRFDNDIIGLYNEDCTLSTEAKQSLMPLNSFVKSEPYIKKEPNFYSSGAHSSDNQFTDVQYLLNYTPGTIVQPYNHNDDDEDDEEDDENNDLTNNATNSNNNNNNNNNKRRKRNRIPNPDAELILQATEENLRLLGDIDPNSKEGKKQRRKIRNRMSAQIHRNRKKEYIESLEKQVQERDYFIATLKEKLRFLNEENLRLSSQIGMPTVPQLPIISASFTSPSLSAHSKLNSRDQAATDSSNSGHSSGDFTTSSDDSSSEGRASPVQSFRPNSGRAVGGFSLFSIFFMFTFSFWNSNFSQMFSFFPSVSPNQFALDAPILNLDYHHGGRVLASLSDSTPPIVPAVLENDRRVATSVAVSLVPVVPHLSDHNREHTALWTRDLMGDIFASNMSPPKNTTFSKQSKGNLRKRNTVTPSANITDTEEPLAWQQAKWFTRENNPSRSLSYVLMTQGKSLLDGKLLAAAHRERGATASRDVGNNGNALSPVSVSSSREIVLPIDKSSDASRAPDLVRIIHHQPHEVPSEKGDGVVPPSPLLLVVLPASSIQWQVNSLDGDDAFRSLIRNSSILGDSEIDMTSVWVEIGCSIIKAQLVQNVTLNA